MATLMVWALLAADDSARHITEVKSGLDCGCVCPGCRVSLEAVNSENPSWKRRPHFRHHKAPELESCADAAVITGAKSCFDELGEILLPGATFVGEAQCLDRQTIRETVEVEPTVAKVVAYEFIDMTDAVLTLADGQQLYVRLIAQGASKKIQSPKQGPLAEIIIDISDPVLRTADRATLRDHISLSAKHRMWCKNQRWATWEADAAMRANRLAREHDEQQSQEKEMRSIQLRMSHDGVVRKFGWASSMPPNTARRARQLQIAIQHYRKSGGFGHPVCNLPFERILKEAENGRIAGSPLRQMLENWDTQYQLVGNQSPIVNVLLVAGLVQVISILGEDVPVEPLPTNPPAALNSRIANLKRLLNRD